MASTRQLLDRLMRLGGDAWVAGPYNRGRFTAAQAGALVAAGWATTHRVKLYTLLVATSSGRYAWRHVPAGEPPVPQP